ncbi:FKBP-type peptidyl-prolyl cis-trans isomerase [Guillardia theta CCMP2712]|uniref:peptidylprolyl isomerase n=1 Tax=Guillardia theta (strain CCMP2712) TaxID=905079 RepID=L1JMZ9_GUITC|nr:FKBP-type peptidyl-prolyl cis-trans isomerase [Guillardia theta CCMP2712]EKX49453.1 FKBP-type peptidyl-prolyl cis-trans isomerase [Guillardia theta CCMP2712]|eukprot:XP_005836433.1 FKBP-type peptidyl-prolyl cis-trans isomerase [Guillardia theta CCMP2712]
MRTALSLSVVFLLSLLPPCASWNVACTGRMCAEHGRRDIAKVSRREVITAAKLVAPSLHLLITREAAAADQNQLSTFQTSGTGLKFVDIRAGSGEEVKVGDKVSFHYIGRLAGRQGKPFEDTYSDEPVRVELGKTRVIKGLEEGLLGMREGGKRRLLIPSSLGYHNKSEEPIPRSFGNRQRLYSTVLNKIRTERERKALGQDIAGVVLMDVEVTRVRSGQM